MKSGISLTALALSYCAVINFDSEVRWQRQLRDEEGGKKISRMGKQEFWAETSQESGW